MAVKDQQSDHYHSECEQMYEAIVNLEKSLSEKDEENSLNLQKMAKLQHQLMLE